MLNEQLQGAWPGRTWSTGCGRCSPCAGAAGARAAWVSRPRPSSLCQVRPALADLPQQSWGHAHTTHAPNQALMHMLLRIASLSVHQQSNSGFNHVVQRETRSAPAPGVRRGAS